MELNRKQLERVQAKLRTVINNKRRTEEERMMAEYYLNEIKVGSFIPWVRDVLAMFVQASKKYIETVMIEGKNLYRMVEIRTHEGSKTKNRICVATIRVEEATRKEAIQIAEAYMKANNINLTDLAYNMY